MSARLALWPDPQSPSSLTWVVAAMLATTAGLIFFFWRRKWL